MKKVMVFGTFDGVHPGHRAFFTQARTHGEHLTVVVARDNTVQTVKGRLPKYAERSRVESVGMEEHVNTALLGNRDDKYHVISTIRPDVICLGYDQEHFTQDLRVFLDSIALADTLIVRLSAFKPDIYKSHLINGLS